MKWLRVINIFLAILSVMQTICAGVMFVFLCMWSAYCKLFWPLIPVVGVLLIMSGAASYKALSPEVLRGEESRAPESKDASFCASEKTDKVA